MSIPTPFNPLGTLGGGWPRELMDGLLDGWILRTPEHTARGGDVIPPTATTGHSANTYKMGTPSTWTAKTLLFCSMPDFVPVTQFNPPQFSDGTSALSCFYGISNLPAGNQLLISEGFIIDTPERYQLSGFRAQRPFDAAVTFDGTAARVYTTEKGWATVPKTTGRYSVSQKNWRYAVAWAAYGAILSDDVAVRRLEILREFATQEQ